LDLTLPWQELLGLELCGLNGTSCSRDLRVEPCRVSCTGFYGDVTRDPIVESMIRDFTLMEDIKMSYNKMKNQLAKNLMYRSTSPKFSKCYTYGVSSVKQ
jgi:hypothetical protein